MERASESEIRKRKSRQTEKGEFFASFFAACIPLLNGLFYWHTGRKVATIAKEQTKVRLMYRVFGWVLLLLPFLIMAIYPTLHSMFYKLSTPITWVIYLVPAFLIAKKHTSILRNLKELEAR